MAFNPVTGNWPGFELAAVDQYQTNGGYATNGVYYPELDIFEWFSSNPTVGYFSAQVWRNNVDVANNGGSNTWSFPGGTVLSNYNTYGVLWTATSISWYFNNQLVLTFSTTGTYYNAVFAGQYALDLIMTEQAGCDGVYGGCPDSTQTSPLNEQVQWVHVYALPAE